MGKRNMAPVFRHHNDDYLYVDQLGEGQRGVVQLVQNIRTGEVVVRKATRPRNRAPKDSALAVDRESSIADYLKSGFPKDGTKPNVAKLYDYSVVRYPAKPESISGCDKISHVSYWEYYNLGELYKFRLSDGGKKTIVAHGPALAARFAHQILNAVAFMYSRGVNHGDLHDKNIFVHIEPNAVAPDFYIGDFDHATMPSTLAQRQHAPGDQMTFASDLQQIKSIIARLMFFANGSRAPEADQYPDMSAIEADLKAMADQFDAGPRPIRQLPDHNALRALAARAAAAEKRYFALKPMAPGASPCIKEISRDVNKSALVHGKEHFLHEGFEPILGPWRLARFSKDGRKILEIRDKTYHQSVKSGWDTDPNGNDVYEEDEPEYDAYDMGGVGGGCTEEDMFDMWDC